MKSPLTEQCARHCRILMLSASNAAVIEQLRLWLEELEQQARALECQIDNPAPGLPTARMNEQGAAACCTPSKFV